MRLAYALCILPLFGFSCTPLPSTKPHVDPGRYVKSIKEGDLTRSYVLRVPKAYDNKTKLPVVVLLHGWTGSADDVETRTRFGIKADQEGFILAVPDGTEGIGNLKGWNCGFLNLGVPKADDVKFVGDILDATEKDLFVDTDRVFVAGHSNGAMMAYDLGAKLSDRIAAIAVVSGTIGTDKEHVSEPATPVSAIIFHGRKDDTVPYDATSKGLIACTAAPDSAKWWADRDGCKPASHSSSNGGNVVVDDYTDGRNSSEVELVSIGDGGHAWPKLAVAATDMIWDFFKAHPKHH